MRQFLRFALIFLGSFSLCLALWTSANILRLRQNVENEAKRACEEVDYKKILAATMPEPKIVVVGASNVTFGVRTSMMSHELGIPVLNGGMPASAGPGIMFDVAKSVLRPGDTALLSLEYFFYEGTSVDDHVAQQAAIQCNTSFWASVSPKRKFYLLMQQDPIDVLEGLGRRLTEALGIASPFKPIEDNIFLNAPCSGATGDHICNTQRSVTPDMVNDVRTHPFGPGFAFQPEGAMAQAVSDFVRWARAHRIRVVGCWPAVYWPEADKGEKGLQRLQEFYAGLDVPMIGKPADTIYPLQDFYDTSNHLTDIAAIDRAAKIIAGMRLFVRARAGETSAANAE